MEESKATETRWLQLTEWKGSGSDYVRGDAKKTASPHHSSLPAQKVELRVTVASGPEERHQTLENTSLNTHTRPSRSLRRTRLVSANPYRGITQLEDAYAIMKAQTDNLSAGQRT
jgi:hypothetical protein